MNTFKIIFNDEGEGKLTFIYERDTSDGISTFTNDSCNKIFNYLDVPNNSKAMRAYETITSYVYANALAFIKETNNVSNVTTLKIDKYELIISYQK